MKEISCKVFTIFFRDMERNKLPCEILNKGVPYTLDHLRNEKENVEWDTYCKVLTNTRAIWNDDDYLRLGHQVVEWKVMPVLSAMLGFFLSPIQVYRLITDTRRGIGTQQFRCMSTTAREFDKHHLEILLELPVGYQYCTEFFLMTKGFFSAVPRFLKLRKSTVTMQATERGALYDISIPRRNSPFTRVRQFFSLPSSRRAVIRELNETYELLYDRFNLLEASKTRIQQQAKQLETAHSIGQLIRSDLDLDSTLVAVSESLIKVAGFVAVEINIHSLMEQEPVVRNVLLGEIPAAAEPLQRKLEGHGKAMGEIKLWLSPKTSTDDANQLLDYLIPTITMELLNALSFKLLDDYRNRLEGKVDEIQHAIIEERRRISSEIHDDLGTNLSAIALMTGVINKNEPGANVEKISIAAQQSLEKISEIVWSLNPRNDKLENLVAYIRKYAMEFFELTPIVCKVNIPQEIPETVMKSEQRRNIFLSVKEALHNVLKHSGATLVELSFLVKDQHGEIIVHDNGKGISPDLDNRFGNGLFNMKQRMQAAGGYSIIENNSGTVIRLGYELSKVAILP